MSPSSPLTVAPILAAFAAMSFAFALYRLSSLNTFVDARKTFIRSVFREVFEAYPDLLLLVQNLGKTGATELEIKIVSSIHPSIGEVAREIHGLREQYNRNLFRLLSILFMLSAFGLGMVFNQGNYPPQWAALIFLLFLSWLVYVWSTLRLERPTERNPKFETILAQLEREAQEIKAFAQSRRAKLHKDASGA